MQNPQISLCVQWPHFIAVAGGHDQIRRITAKPTSLHIRCICLKQDKAPVVPVIRMGNTKTASKITIKIVPELKLKYLFTDIGINFELRPIWNFLQPISDKSDNFHDFRIVIKISLNYTQIENFDDVMSDPLMCTGLHCPQIHYLRLIALFAQWRPLVLS